MLGSGKIEFSTGQCCPHSVQEIRGSCVLQDSQPLKECPEPGRLSDIRLGIRGYRKPLWIYLNFEPNSCGLFWGGHYLYGASLGAQW